MHSQMLANRQRSSLSQSLSKTLNTRKPLTCTNLSTCLCSLCNKQQKIINLLTVRQQLEWFGKKKPTSSFNKHLQTLVKHNDPQRKKNNKKNQTEFEEISKVRSTLDCNSTYFKSYQLKNIQQQKIHQPVNCLSFQKSIIDNKKSIYKDSFKHLNITVETQKMIKPIQNKYQLPFFGKSSYKQSFLLPLNSAKNIILKPRDLIKTIDINHSKTDTSLKAIEASHKSSQIYRPVSPIIRKGHMMKSNSIQNGYQTLYKVSFNNIDSTNNQIIRNQPNPEFLRRSKYGSMSKVRWGQKRIPEQSFFNPNKRDASLTNLYS